MSAAGCLIRAFSVSPAPCPPASCNHLSRQPCNRQAGWERRRDLYSSSAAASKKRVKIALGRFVNNNDLLAGLGSHEHLKGGLQEGGGLPLRLQKTAGSQCWQEGTGDSGQQQGIGGSVSCEMGTPKHPRSSLHVKGRQPTLLAWGGRIQPSVQC